MRSTPLTDSAHAAGSLAALTHAPADRYRVERELGAGGMATVYLAHDILDPSNGSVTLLPPGLTMDMKGGWSADGRIVYYTQDIESALWRFRSAGAGAGER